MIESGPRAQTALRLRSRVQSCGVRHDGNAADESTYQCGNDDLSAEEIGIVVTQIRQLRRAAGLNFALGVGALIIRHFYKGNANAWRSRGAKIASFRRLAAHPELPLSPGSLYRCVALYELCDRLQAPSRWEHLGSSHLRLVIGLPPDIQEKLLSTADARRWSVKTLQEAVGLARRTPSMKGGRRVQPPITKALSSVKKCLSGWQALIEQAHLSSDDVQCGLRMIEDAKMDLEQLSSRLQATQGGAPAGNMQTSNGSDAAD
jgi:hypothetical protein